MHLGMPECHKPFFGHCDLDLWPSFQELLCPEHISYIIWCRNPKFGVVIPLGMAEWCIQFWVILTLTLTSGFISRFFLLYYSYLSSNVSCARPIPLGAFVTCLWHFLLCQKWDFNVILMSSNIHTLVLMNLINSFRERDKMLGKPRISSLILNLLNEFNKSCKILYIISEMCYKKTILQRNYL